jgi:hypothetical protein
MNMTERAIPFVMGTGTSLRFDRADIKAMENALGIGYPHFIQRGIFGSLTAMEVYLWRGMRQETPEGNLVHAFALDDTGKEKAGDTLFKHLQAGGDEVAVNNAILDAFIASGLFHKRTPEPTISPESEKPPKNSQT